MMAVSNGNICIANPVPRGSLEKTSPLPSSSLPFKQRNQFELACKRLEGGEGGGERNGSALCLKYLAKWDSFYSPFIAVMVMGSLGQ